MKMQLIQIGAITRYEFRMQWRQRPLKVMTLAMLVMTVVPMFIIGNDISNAAVDGNGVNWTNGIISISFMYVGICLAMLTPVVMADAVPRDRALKVWDILHTSSMQIETYLAGKVLGSVAAVMSSVLIVAVVVGVLWRVFIGGYELDTYLEAWFIGAAGMTFINIGLVTLFAAPMGNRRWAVAAAIFFCFTFPTMVSFKPRHDWLDLLSPVRPGIFFRYANILEPDVKNLSILLTLVGGIVQVLVVGVIVNWWMRSHEA